MKLIELFNADLNKSFDLYNSFGPDENGFENSCYGMSFDMYKQYVDLKEKHSKGLCLRPGYVPDTIYVLVNDDGDYVGLFNFRHYLNDALKEGAGHIGYGIRKEFRNKGYATKGLELLLLICKERDIKEVYMSCHLDNEASLKVQLKNGAYVHHKDQNNNYTRINL